MIDLPMLLLTVSLMYAGSMAVTYLFGSCVFAVEGIDRPWLLMLCSAIWIIGIFYIIVKAENDTEILCDNGEG